MRCGDPGCTATLIANRAEPDVLFAARARLAGWRGGRCRRHRRPEDASRTLAALCGELAGLLVWRP